MIQFNNKEGIKFEIDPKTITSIEKAPISMHVLGTEREYVTKIITINGTHKVSDPYEEAMQKYLDWEKSLVASDGAEPKIDIQQHIQTVREALERCTQGTINVEGKELWVRRQQYDGENRHEWIGDIPDPNNMHLFSNSPEWLRHSIEIIEQQQRDLESLRSQLDAINSRGRDGRRYTNADYELVRARAQQAERERDELRTQLAIAKEERDSIHRVYLLAMKANTAAETALLNGLRWYASPGTYQINVTGQWEPKLAIVSDAGKRARDLLAQYDK